MPVAITPMATPQLKDELPALSFLYPFEWENQWVRAHD